ncbi:hypothetical protein N9M16_00585 [Candidatus Dependentiae bacterium]|nr:hypothetical protein [Candidatus Dependentiae bacterium]
MAPARLVPNGATGRAGAASDTRGCRWTDGAKTWAVKRTPRRCVHGR